MEFECFTLLHLTLFKSEEKKTKNQAIAVTNRHLNHWAIRRPKNGLQLPPKCDPNSFLALNAFGDRGN